MKRVLIISGDIIAKKMAGPGIRYFNFAKELSKEMEVTLAVPEGSEMESNYFKVAHYSITSPLLYKRIKELIDSHDVVIAQHIFPLRLLPFVIKTNKAIIIDLYDPIMFEILGQYFTDGLSRQGDASYKCWLYETKLQLGAGSFFICANDRQRDLWLGMLSGLGIITADKYVKDNSLKRLIDIVPFGIENNDPVKSKQVLKGVHPNIKSTDKLVIWGGGIWNWLDPLTVIKAIAYISRTRDDVKFFFMGVKRPNPLIPQMEMVSNAINLAKELDVLDKHVFFNYDWIPYEERHNYLMEADIGISMHFETVETRFAFRTRVLDYFWAGIPVIVAKGDSISELVSRECLGIVVDCKDDKELADGILRLVDDKDFRTCCIENIKKIREEYRWSNVVQPILNYCKNTSEGEKRTKNKTAFIWALILMAYLHRFRESILKRGLKKTLCLVLGFKG